MARGPAWSKEEDFLLVWEIMASCQVRPSKSVLENVAKRLPGGRTTIAIIRRWENLNQEFKVGKPSSKAKSSPAGTPPKSTPAKAKSRSPKETGKKVTFDQPSTPCSTPNQSNDGTMSPEDALMQPKRWSSREQSRKNYAEIDVPESNGEEMDSSEEVEFEAVEIKTE